MAGGVICGSAAWASRLLPFAGTPWDQAVVVGANM